jgi:hypothetical protein
MNFLRSKWIQKISATTLVVFLFFIHAVKILHTHDYSPTDILNNGSSVLKTNFTCTICDFQLSKDADAFVQVLHFSSPLSFIAVSHYYAAQQPVSFSLVSSVRGPPPIS